MDHTHTGGMISLLGLDERQFAPKYVELAHRLLRDIADRGLKPGDRLGTETELVSTHNLSRATVRQALSVLERDGYVSRRRAQGTFVGRSVEPSSQSRLTRGTVLVVCSNEQTTHLDEDFAFATVLRLMERALAKQGFTVQILGVGENAEDDQVHLRRLVRNGRINGICAIGNCFESYRRLVPGEVLVASSCTFSPLQSPWVGQDVRSVSRESVKYLLDRGHRHIAMVCSAGIDQAAFSIFAAGYRDAFAEASIPVNRQLFFHAYAGESLTQCLTEVLGAPLRPTAIFAENWRVCQAVMAAASQLGLRIPQDVSLLGYGQNSLQLSAPIVITSYVPDAERIGQQVAQILTMFADGLSVPGEPVFVSGRLVEGESVRVLS
jgi:GntR family transcriptional regulator, arabinose operon transcriptional repressor